MNTYFTPTRLQSALALAVALIASVWWVTVPHVIAASTFVALCAVLAASAWVVLSTFQNARPASSLAQSLHDEPAAAVKPGRRRS